MSRRSNLNPRAIDRQLRELARELVVREVAWGRLLEVFFSADGWRRLGYATAMQYARERLGCSLSSIKSKRQLARRLGQLRFLTDAVERGELGYEAARLVAAVATRATVEGWVARAKERTLRHLREEIDVAELLARWSGNPTAVPPGDEDVRRVQELERAVVAGQISAPPAAATTGASATVKLRLRVHASTARSATPGPGFERSCPSYFDAIPSYSRSIPSPCRHFRLSWRHFPRSAD